jgi:glycosyltransferase involved in cell wall biosynthesis
MAQRYTDRVFSLEFKGHAAGKAELAERAKHDWVLVLDADERVSPELWQEIRAIVENPQTELKGMQLRRRSFFLGKKMRAWDNDFQLRLYRRDAARWNKATIHSGVEVSGKVIQSTGYLDHHTDPSLSHVLRKMNAYTNANAADLLRANKRGITVAMAFIHAFSTFFRTYLIRGAIWDGRLGLVFACIQALYNWFRYLKAWEIKKGIAPMPGLKDFMPA